MDNPAYVGGHAATTLTGLLAALPDDASIGADTAQEVRYIVEELLPHINLGEQFGKGGVDETAPAMHGELQIGSGTTMSIKPGG